MNSFDYTGPEALEITKSTYGKNWETEIEEAKSKILLIGRIYKKNHVEAYKKFINSGCCIGTSITYFAALHVLLEEEKKLKNSKLHNVNELRKEQERFINHLEAVEQSKEDVQSKRTLRQYYTNKRDELQKSIDEIINTFVVVDHKLVIHQGNLFGGISPSS